MPWSVKDKMELRLEFVLRVLGGERKSKLCREYGISRPTGDVWVKRFTKTESIRSLYDRSHKTKSCPHKTDEYIEKEVIKLRKRYGWGAVKLQVLLRKEGIVIPKVTINRIIERNGLLIEEDCHRPAVKRFEKERANDLWQVDLKGAIGRNNARCEPLSMIDDYSRFVVGLFPTRTSKLEPIQEAFHKTFEKYGIPEALLMDHGVPWWSSANMLGLTRLSVWLMKQDIRLCFSGYNHPQTQGKVERFHRTLAHAIRHNGTPTKFSQWSSLLSKIQREYNYIRPHEALSLDVPASRYSRSKRQFIAQPSDPNYPNDYTIAKVDTLGCVRINKLRLFTSEALVGEHVGVLELDKSAVVYYRKTPIREIDFKTGKSIPFTPTAYPH